MLNILLCSSFREIYIALLAISLFSCFLFDNAKRCGKQVNFFTINVLGIDSSSSCNGLLQ